MNKVLVGVGIGCGSLVLIGVIAAVGFGLWAKGKVEESGLSFEQLEQTGKRTKAVQKQVSSLNAKYAFQAPPKGQPVQVEEDRLTEYLAVRAALVPVYKEFEQKAEALSPKDGKKAGIADSFKAIGLMSELMTGLQEKWVVELDQHRMSPREYNAITAALYTSVMGVAAGEIEKHQRTALTGLKRALEEQLANEKLPEAERDGVRQQVKELEAQIAALPAEGATPPEQTEIHKHNAALMEKHKADLESYANPMLDQMFLGAGADLDEAFRNIQLGNEKAREDQGPRGP